MTEEIIKRIENPDSIEWRFTTGKSVKVYGNVGNPADFKKRLQAAIKILKEVDEENTIKLE